MFYFKVHNLLTQEKFSIEKRGKEDLTRNDLVKLKTIINMNETLKKKERLHVNELISLEFLVKKLERQNAILIFKPSGFITLKIGPTDCLQYLSVEVFVLGFQTEEQVKAMEKGKDSMLFIDATHKTNIVGYQLLNVLVKDEEGKGYPVAFFLLSDVKSETVSACLLALKIRTPTFLPKVIGFFS